MGTHTKLLSLGQRIRKARREIGLSQKDVARELNISDKTVSSYEVNRAKPSFSTIKKISGIVHKPISYFDENADTDELDLQLKIKTIEKELKEVKELLKKRKTN